MTDKRYAIVRVDDDYNHLCPSAFEKIDDSFFCKLAKRKGGSCNVCPYGDTKEQLVAKIKTVLDRITKCNFIEYKYRNKYFLLESNYIAKEIVEFLGGKE